MTAVQIYSNQYPWRRWSDVYPELGCSIGVQTRDLAGLGAEVLDSIRHFSSARRQKSTDRIPGSGLFWHTHPNEAAQDASGP